MEQSQNTASNILEVKNITKIYPGGTIANHNINFAVQEGEIHALVGENGAGKTTLMKMLFGIESVTSGEIYFRGEKQEFTSTAEPIALGLGMVHQHFMLIPSFTVAENLLLGVEERRLGFFTDVSACVKATNEIAAKYGFEIDAEKRVRDIGVSMKQKLEILKALYRGARVLILDEPTAVLTPQETDQLFEQLIGLKEQGITIIFISHKLNEVKRISDRVTVLRDGESQGTYDADELTEMKISNLMVGRDITFHANKKPVTPGEVALRVENLRYKDKFGVTKLDGVSLAVRKGEILGVAGVEGNGQSELSSIISGLMKPDEGQVYIDGADMTGKNSGDFRRAGLSHVPEDRMYNGCIAGLALQDNLVSNVFGELTTRGMMDKKKVSEYASKIVKEYSVKAQSLKSPLKSLSGGNMQKAIVGREFSVGADALLVNHPTRGIDVGAEEMLRHKVLDMREEMKAVLLISASLPELLALSDRIVVFNGGRITGYLTDVPNTSESDLGLYMLGLKEDDAERIAEVAK
ncbi:MAG: ABC transporter ATP-binding protein [Oscillospiraceae bacterium]|nr:ABC transporter ATP-binding protein [Oscillospiraceae bacterium]